MMDLFLRVLNRLIRISGYRFSKIPVVSPTKKQVFSIGLYEGDSPFSLTPKNDIKNPLLKSKDITDVNAEFVADPFMLQMNKQWYMFFEIKNRSTKKGEIGLAVSEDAVNWRYEGMVLVEPFHLSYPYVFFWDSEIYMIPETRATKTVRLYKATQFPYTWEFTETLLSGENFSDASIVRYNNLWWLFTGNDIDYTFDTLKLYYSKNLSGPWQTHPQNPIVKGDSRIARPAGRIILYEDVLIRYNQDCTNQYGLSVNASVIKKLSEKEYVEEEYQSNPILTGSGSGWNSNGMHHIDAHRIENNLWIAAVDGWYEGIR